MGNARAVVCIPTYNEKENIGKIAAAVLAAAPEVDVLIVDDNSPDGTGAIADDLARENPRIRVLHRAAKEGLGRAYLAAFRWALQEGYDRIVQMDADFSHHPRYVPILLAQSERADVVIGSRNVRGGGAENWGIFRHAISKGGSLYARAILGLRVRDLTGGLKCWRAETLRGIGLDNVISAGLGFQVEMTYRAIKKGFHVVEIPIVFVDRRAGYSKMSTKIFIEAMLKIWAIRLRS